MMRWAGLATLGLAALSGCLAIPIGTSERPVGEPDGGTTRMRAVLRDAAGKTVAIAALTQTDAGVKVGIDASAMTAGTYGAHLHAVGRCDAPDFTSAGGHWNPSARQHGRDNPQGAHLGDLPNLVVGRDGHGSVSFTISQAKLSDGANPIADADGAAMMLHAAADDYRTDPSGNSGARIACGIVGKS